MKLKETRTARRLTQEAVAKRIGCDAPLLSKMENYKCLPVPATMEALLATLDCGIEDLYDENEITFPGFAKTKTQHQTPKKEAYKITVRLPKEARQALPEMLKACGYRDITYWVWRCYERLQCQYQHTPEKKKSRPAATGTAQKK